MTATVALDKKAATARLPFKVKDLSLAEFGRKEIAIAEGEKAMMVAAE